MSIIQIWLIATYPNLIQVPIYGAQYKHIRF